MKGVMTMRVEAKHRETGEIIKGTLVEAQEVRYFLKSQGLHPRELILLE